MIASTWDNVRSGTARCATTERPLIHQSDYTGRGLAMEATRTCSIDGCERAAAKRGWCTPHYRRWIRHGDPTAGRRPPVGGTCAVADCGRPHRTGGYCNMHALRVRKHGDPSHVDKGGRPRYGAEHPNWKGDQAGYLAIHVRLRTNRGHASAHPCAECGDVAAEWAYDHTDPNEQLDERGCPYSPDPAHYRPLCLSCHRSADARAVP